MDCSLPGSSVHVIFQARILEWVAISSFKGFSWPRDWTQVSRTASKFFTVWASREASKWANLGLISIFTLAYSLSLSLSLSLSIYIYIYVCMYVYIFVCVCVCIYIYIYMYIFSNSVVWRWGRSSRSGSKMKKNSSSSKIQCKYELNHSFFKIHYKWDL